MQTHFKTKQLCVAITLAMSAIGLTACGGGSSGGNVPIVKEYDSFIGGADSLSQHAFANTTHELPKLSKNGLPLKYTYRENSEEFCTLSADGYSVKLLPNKENKINRCDLWVDNQGGNARFKGISSAYVIDIYPVCEDGQKNGEQSHLCIPTATTIDPISAPVTNVNQDLKFTVSGYNLKGNLDKLKIKTDACSDIKRSKDAVTDYTDKDSFVISCIPDTAGTFDLTISDGTTQLLKSQINVELPKVIGGKDILFKTGITTCSTDTEKNMDCKKLSEDWIGLNQDGEVQAGADFKYSKKIHQNPTTHETETCIQDDVTGLMWETKTDDDGLRDKDWAYTWFNPNNSENGGTKGSPGKDTCGGTLATSGNKCNSKAYIDRLNEIQYCGYNDWRLPEANELIGLLDYGQLKPPLVNKQYFTQPINYRFFMTATTASYFTSFMAIDFASGVVNEGHKDSEQASYAIRAVRAD
ncbi:Lcl C-terminal domain-containing protein [Psychrobacter sp. I-STPA10]|uniref:Lcl C-terminal domain-containing protein n=1 Tax=Psychrobacter sp. I-STPA10 TaxID=2585769 RepID=UPI001E5B93D8|nr:DUF1566 domain-containing protein [Psychrobacter sp. I-STPA10]